MLNATWLTQKYPGREDELWTQCIYDFFCLYKPELPISSCIESPAPKGPWYQSRSKFPYLKIDRDILKHPATDDFLSRIGANYGLNLIDDDARYPDGNDIAGIAPDIVLIKSEKKGVFIMENKPYDSSSFDGNQGPGGAYIAFVLWMNKIKIPCEYIVVHSIRWNNNQYDKEMQIQRSAEFFWHIVSRRHFSANERVQV